MNPELASIIPIEKVPSYLLPLCDPSHEGHKYFVTLHEKGILDDDNYPKPIMGGARRKIDNMPESEVIEMYNRGMTMEEIASHFGVSITPVDTILTRNNVEKRSVGPQERIIERGVLEQLYGKEGNSCRQIAKELNTNHTTVMQWIEFYGIEKGPLQ